MEKPGFEVTLIKSAGGLGMALFALALVFGAHKGAHKRLGFVETLMGSEVTIEGEAHVQIDGDYFGFSPVRITAEADMLKVVG